MNLSPEQKGLVSSLSVKDVTKAELLGSFLLFARVFFKLKTGREFVISNPPGREPHIITMARELKAVFNMETTRLLINVPPGYHKSTLLCLWVAWCYANHADCNFLYISVAYELAEKHTAFIKEIMELSEYKQLFGVHLRSDSKSKGKFKTESGGACVAFGAKGAVVGNDAGLPNLKRFSGCVIMDDMHSPADCFSDTMRQAVVDNFLSTIRQRPRGSNVPIIFIGQRLHEQDLPAYFIDGREGYEWKKVILQSLDEHDNPLYPEVFPYEMLEIMRKTDEYTFFAQHQQNPQPSGGGIFKRDWFPLTDLEPPIVSSFLTIDTAETDENWSDFTAMSFWGIYKLQARGIDTGQYAIHWLDARQIRIEPKDLEAEFYDFYMGCMRHKVKPDKVLIEKKSAGTTLVSILKGVPGMHAIPIERNAGGGNKTARFYECQKYVASGRVTLPRLGRHTEMCLEHMRKITGNMAHAHDDLCFVANTKIATQYGYKNIQDIRIGDYVITPMGLGKITESKKTGEYSVVTKIGLTGTQNHPVYANNQFLPLISLDDTMTFDKLSLIGLIKWRLKTLLYSMESDIICLRREDITELAQKRVNIISFIEMYGHFVADRKYRKAFMFTTKIITALIMTLKIWNAFHAGNIVRSIISKGRLTGQKWKKCGKNLLNIMPAQRVWQQIKKKLKNFLPQQIQLNAVTAPLNLCPLGSSIIYAQKNAEDYGEINSKELNTKNWNNLQENALFAENNSRQRSHSIINQTEKLVPMPAQETMDMRSVYNLTVEHHGVYYANDILVSNCDTLEMSCRAVFIDESLLPYAGANVSILSTLSNDVNKLAALRARG